MEVLQGILNWFRREPEAEHLRRGRIGEAAARKHLQKMGMRFLTANFAGPDGEIDLVFRDGECLVFVEVKSRSDGGWTRPAEAVDERKRRALRRTAAHYLGRLRDSRVRFRFDIVEVMLEVGRVGEVRHLPDAFSD